jgi:hypothetical protein
MNMEIQNIVNVYHDETRNANFGKYRGHIFLFVPQELKISRNSTLFGKDVKIYYPADFLHEKIQEVRDSNRLSTRKIHFTDISGKQWGKSDEGLRIINEILVDALRHKFPQIFSFSLSCKIAVMFYPNKANVKIYGGEGKEQYLRNDETMMRMLLKGAVHSLYDDYNKIRIDAIYTDGQPMHRTLDEKRVIDRLKREGTYGRKPLRDHVDFAHNIKIIGLNTDHTKYNSKSSEYKHSNYLQLADLLLGSIIKSCYSGTRRCKDLTRIRSSVTAQDKKAIIAYPVMKMLEKKKRGADFRNSGHYKAFYLSELIFVDSAPVFNELKVQEATLFPNTPEIDFGI